MIRSIIEKHGDEYVVVIAEEAMYEHGLHEGDQVEIEPIRQAPRTALRPEVEQAWEDSWERNEEGYRYLADR